MNFDDVLRWNKRFHSVSKVAGTANALSSGGALASDIAVFAADIPGNTQTAHEMVEMFKLDVAGKGPMACVLCDTLYVGSLTCPECGGAGDQLDEHDCTDEDPFAGNPFSG